MPVYDQFDYSPPAPVAEVSLENPDNGYSVDKIRMLIDTGADVTLVPESAIRKLVDDIGSLPTYELEGFDGSRSNAQAVALKLSFLGKTFRGQFLATKQQHGILGRNILNCLSICLNGPELSWAEIRQG